MKPVSPYKQKLLDLTSDRPSPLWTNEGTGIRCVACGHRCFIPTGLDGICKVRTNVDGKLKIPWGYVAGLQLDPIEKKPFFHVLPKAKALSFGMLGCDLHCAYCQNWITSQSLRDPGALARPEPMSPQMICDYAVNSGAQVLTSTYNEPLITSEWAVEIFREAKKRGLKTSYVSNGNGTPEVLEFIRPHVDYYKIDLKSFSDKHYRQLGGVLDRILETIRLTHQMGFWLEIVTLVIPGFNDSLEEMKKLTEFLVGVSPDIPWHVTGYHQDYKMQENENTRVDTLLEIAKLGKSAGLKFVYAGNRPGLVGGWENTYCPGCKTELITRRGFHVFGNRICDGKCPDCGEAIPGVWA